MTMIIHTDTIRNLYKTNKSLLILILLTLGFSVSSNESISLKNLKGDENTTEKALKNKLNAQLKYTSGILSIFHDSKGRYWFGSHNQGVAMFEGENFTYFTVQDGLSDNQIRTIQESDDGKLWFGTGEGVSYFDGNVMKSYNLDESITHVESAYLGFIKAPKQNQLWFNAGRKSGIYRLTNNQINYLPFPVEKYKGNESYQSYATTDFDNSLNDHVWIATYGAVFKYDGINFSTIDNQTLGYSEPQLHVRSLLEDSKGNVWIGNNGIGVLLKKEDKVINFSDEMGLIHDNSTRSGNHSPAGTLEHVFVIEEDKQGNIWFGDRDTGAWKYDGEKMTNYSMKNGLSHNFAQTIYTDKSGGQWLGLSDGSVYLFNGTSFDRKFAIRQK